MFDRIAQLRMLLPYDLVKRDSLLGRLLQLRERLAGLHCVTLPAVPNQQNPVVWCRRVMNARICFVEASEGSSST